MSAPRPIDFGLTQRDLELYHRPWEGVAPFLPTIVVVAGCGVVLLLVQGTGWADRFMAPGSPWYVQWPILLICLVAWIGVAIPGYTLVIYLGWAAARLVRGKAIPLSPFKARRAAAYWAAIERYEAVLAAAELERRQREEAYWQSLSGIAFEREIGRLFQAAGYDAEVTRASGDGGADIFLRRGNVLTVVQCKRHTSPVGPAVARELYGTMLHHHAQRGILVSSGGFTRGVYEFVRGKPIELMSMDEILRMVRTRDP